MASETGIGASRREIRRGSPVAVAGVVLTPVILYERHGGSGASACGLYAAQRPIAVIVAGPQGRRMLRFGGDVDDL